MDLIDQPQTKRLTAQELKILFSRVTTVLQKPVSERTDEDLSHITTILNNTSFFHRNLDSQISLYEFISTIKHYATYETHPAGTAIFQEGQYANKFYIILKGTAVKFQHRGLDDIEQEALEKHRSTQKEREIEEYKAKKASYYEAFHQMSQSRIDVSKKGQRSTGTSIRSKTKSHTTKPRIEDVRSPTYKRPGLLVSIGSVDSGSEEMNEMREGSSVSGSYSGSLVDLDAEIPSAKSSQRKTAGTTAFPLTSKGSLGKMRKKSGKRYEEKKLAKQTTVEEEEIKELQEAAETDDEEKVKDEKKKEEIRRFREMMDRQSDIRLFHEMGRKNQQVINKYFVGDIFKLKRVREYQPGGYFGENFMKMNRPKESLLVAAEEIHLLVISKESYLEVMSQLHEGVKEKIEFFLTVFPSVDGETIRSFAYYFKERVFQKSERIYSEDDPTDGLYVVKVGSVRLFKRIEGAGKDRSPHTHAEALLLTTPKTKPEFSVASIVEKQVFGEEVLLKEAKRQYSAVSKNTGTKVYLLEGWLYQKIKGNFAGIVQILRAQAREKANWRQTRVEDMMGSVSGVMEQMMPAREKTGTSTMYERNWVKKNGGIGGRKMGEAYMMTEGNETERRQQHERHSSCEDVDEGTINKNLGIYKEKFFRKTFTNNVVANETFMRRTEDEKYKGNPFGKGNLELIVPVKRNEKKHYLSVSHHNSNQVQLPSVGTLQNLTPRTSGLKEGHRTNKDGSLQSLEKVDKVGSPTIIQNMHNLRINLLQVLTPEYQEGGETLVKNPDGSIVVVSGRSRLRGILKTLNQLPDLGSALQSSRGYEKFMLASPKSGRKMSNPQKLKNLRKVHVIREHFKSPSPTVGGGKEKLVLASGIQTHRIDCGKFKI